MILQAHFSVLCHKCVDMRVFWARLLGHRSKCTTICPSAWPVITCIGSCTSCSFKRNATLSASAGILDAIDHATLTTDCILLQRRTLCAKWTNGAHGSCLGPVGHVGPVQGSTGCHNNLRGPQHTMVKPQHEHEHVLRQGYAGNRRLCRRPQQTNFQKLAAGCQWTHLCDRCMTGTWEAQHDETRVWRAHLGRQFIRRCLWLPRPLRLHSPAQQLRVREQSTGLFVCCANGEPAMSCVTLS